LKNRRSVIEQDRCQHFLQGGKTFCCSFTDTLEQSGYKIELIKNLPGFNLRQNILVENNKKNYVV